MFAGIVGCVAVFGLAVPAHAAEGDLTVNVTYDGAGVNDMTVEVRASCADSSDATCTPYYGSVESTDASGSAALTGVPDRDLTIDVYDTTDPTRYLSPQVDTPFPSTGVVDIALSAAFACAGDVSRVAGTPAVGQALTAQATFVGGSPETVYYNWTSDVALDSDGHPFQVSDSATYTPTEADFGHVIVVHVAATSGDGHSATCNIAVPAIGRIGVPVSGGPVVVGTVKKGRTIRADPGVVSPGTTVGQQWFRVFSKRVKRHRVVVTQAIPGATGATYKLKRKDKGKRVYVQVTYTKAGYNPTVLNSGQSKVR